MHVPSNYGDELLGVGFVVVSEITKTKNMEHIKENEGGYTMKDTKLRNQSKDTETHHKESRRRKGCHWKCNGR